MQLKLQYNIGVAMQDNAAQHNGGTVLQYWQGTQFQILVKLLK